MLLDRKRINRWAKWVALGLAIVFGLSFVFMGVGTGINVDWTELWNFVTGRDASVSTAASGPEEQIRAFEQTLAANPDDVIALKGIADAYLTLGAPLQAAGYLEQAAAIAPDDFDVWMLLAAIYMAPDSRDYSAAVRVLTQATALDSNASEAFLQLGAAERGIGNIPGAIMAWNRYLQLEPEGDLAPTVRAELEVMSTPATVETTSTAGGDSAPEQTTTTAQ